MSMFITPRFYTHAQPTFGGFGSLQSLVEDFDRQLRAAQCQRQVVRRVRKFSPKFDVKETDTSFVLHGELPGIEKDNIHIEFSDPQTILVRGHVDHSYTAGSPPASLTSDAADKEASNPEAGEEPVVIDSSDAEETSSTSSTRSFQATVEDEAEEGGSSSSSSSSSATVAQPTPASTVAEPARPAEEQPKPAQRPSQKYWVSERSYGQFSRSFAFPTRVEADAVTASLDSGILTVTIPKAPKHESHRILIN